MEGMAGTHFRSCVHGDLVITTTGSGTTQPGMNLSITTYGSASTAKYLNLQSLAPFCELVLWYGWRMSPRGHMVHRQSLWKVTRWENRGTMLISGIICSGFSG